MKKKNIFVLALTAALGLSSCDMDKDPYTSYPMDKYMVSVQQFVNARQGLYDPFRTMTTGVATLAPEFMTELFMPMVFFSNTYGDMSSWNIEETNGTIETIWGNYYTMIARANYIIDSYARAKEGQGEFTEEELQQVAVIIGEAYFVRAYSYFNMVLLYCDVYDKNQAETQMGLPLQLKYEPSQYAEKYPGRSTLAATYKQILEDLTSAKSMITSEKSLNYISQHTLQAFEARVALHMKEYGKAAELSAALIGTGKYPLVKSSEALNNLWLYDEGSEIIWQIYQAVPDEVGGSLGLPFHGQYLGASGYPYAAQRPDFHPTTALLELYGDGDMRAGVYFRQYTLDQWGHPEMHIYTFNKFPGNPLLQKSGLSTDNWYTNISEPFMIAEQYLIAAEAYLEDGNAPEAAKYLNALRSSRIQGYVDETFSDTGDLRQAIHDERTKELVGEGFHFYDLKRWKLGFDRSHTEQVAGVQLAVPYFSELKIEAGDYRFTWPIPKAEIDANPQLKDEQNPGY